MPCCLILWQAQSLLSSVTVCVTHKTIVGQWTAPILHSWRTLFWVTVPVLVKSQQPKHCFRLQLGTDKLYNQQIDIEKLVKCTAPNRCYSVFGKKRAQKDGMFPVQDGVGNERRLHRENWATGGRNLAKLYSGLHAAASALEQSWPVWKEGQPNPLTQNKYVQLTAKNDHVNM